MERLPYIDQHSIRVGASRDDAWRALVSVLHSNSLAAIPAPLAGIWGLEPRARSGRWAPNPAIGDTLPGFAVADSRAPDRLRLDGGHRFSRYSLIFELEESERGAACTLRASTFAEFPGIKGKAYRALVIGSGGHRLAVVAMLRRIAARAGRRNEQSA